ncbi:MAG: MBL fold metallo-hydrolase [Candidatus Puniceispirillales bacterium]
MLKHDIDPPQFGDMRRLADDLYWLRFDLPFRLNHINLYVLDCADGWTVIDCGVNDAATASHWQALLEGPLAGQPVRRIIVSHNHVDHIGYAAPLAAITGAEIIMGEAEYDRTNRMLAMAGPAFGAALEAAYRRYGMDEDALAMAREDHDRYSRFVAPLPEVNLIEAGAVIESRNGVWEIRIDHGHSIGQLGFTDHGRGLYIAVDFLLPRISPNISADFETPEVDKLGPYLEYLKAMTQLDPAMLILPGHDWPFSKGNERAAALIDHHQQRLDALMAAAAKAPLTTADAMQVLFDRVFGAHEIFFASGEARAHLGHLVSSGRMDTFFDNGIENFRLT